MVFIKKNNILLEVTYKASPGILEYAKHINTFCFKMLKEIIQNNNWDLDFFVKKSWVSKEFLVDVIKSNKTPFPQEVSLKQSGKKRMSIKEQRQ